MLSIPFDLITLSFSGSAIVCLVIILLFSRTAPHTLKRQDTSAVQASHLQPTPRIGGLAITVALFTTAAVAYGADGWHLIVFLLVSILPVFFAGLAEDLGNLVNPRKRLLAAAVSGAVFIALTGQWITYTDIPGIDMALQWSPVAVGFSLFLTVGIIHSINLIDGLNGFAGFTTLSVALSLAVIAHQNELTEHYRILLIVAAAILGFLVFNFPFGKIFLGDAGAYGIGHLLVWMSVSILWHAPNVTPIGMLLIFFWPIADTFLAIARRLYLGKLVSHPDRLHFHQLVMRTLEITFVGRNNRQISNPLATLLALPFVLAPMVAGVTFALDRGNAAIACFAFTIFFISTYKTIMWLAPKMRRRN